MADPEGAVLAGRQDIDLKEGGGRESAFAKIKVWEMIDLCNEFRVTRHQHLYLNPNKIARQPAQVSRLSMDQNGGRIEVALEMILTSASLSSSWASWRGNGAC